MRCFVFTLEPFGKLLFQEVDDDCCENTTYDTDDVLNQFFEGSEVFGVDAIDCGSSENGGGCPQGEVEKMLNHVE
ncbi:MAG TPA: hypothetical protein PLM49_04795 [Bacteroidales bacterium]|nr:hypothetical protein [Bacteroidales bacterium]